MGLRQRQQQFEGILRPPDSRRDRVLTEMPVASESAVSVTPRSWRIRRSRGPTSASTRSYP